MDDSGGPRRKARAASVRTSPNRAQEADIPPKAWADLALTDDVLVVSLSGWRRVWAVKSALRIPLREIRAAEHDPAAYSRVQTRRMPSKRPTADRLWRVGAYHGWTGWSFWACGPGKNAVVIETHDYRYQQVVIEVLEPAKWAALIRRAAALPEPAPKADIRKISDAKRARLAGRTSPENSGPPRPERAANAPGRVRPIRTEQSKGPTEEEHS